jgi:hypothetical protein
VQDQPELLLALERPFAHRFIAGVEATLVLVDPISRRLVRRVARAGRVMREERLVRRDRLGVLDELDRPVGQILTEVVSLLGLEGLLDRVVVVNEVGVPLIGLGAEEPVERSNP